VTRRELSDSEWELVEPFLPIGRYGPFPRRLRGQFEGVIWRFRTGSQWREMPEEFGAWQTVYDKTPASYMAGLQLRGSIIWMRSLNPGPRSRRPTGKPAAATAHVRPKP
jgi:transposase